MPPVQLLAAGSNSHSELQPSHRSDIRTFTPIITNTDSQTLTLLFPNPSFPTQGSTTLLHTTTNTIHGLGTQNFNQALRTTIDGNNLTQAFGDYHGMAGCLDLSGNFCLMSITMDGMSPMESWRQQRSLFRRLLREDAHLERRAWAPHLASPRSVPRPAYRPKWDGVGIEWALCHVPSAPRVSHVAYVSAAEKGDIVLVLEQESGDEVCRIVQLESLDELCARLDNTSKPASQLWAPTFTLSGRAKQLVGSWGIFLLLMDSGEIYSWGDARFECLGRSVVGEGAISADRPGLVEGLGGINVVEVAAGGWMRAAISDDGAGYLWGSDPNFHRTVKPLREVEAGGIALITLSEEEWDLDILDVAIGSNHVVVLDGKRRVWVIGDNHRGQLGLGVADESVDDWVCVPSVTNVRSIACGMHTTYINGVLK